MECLPCFESASPERAKSLSRAHLVRSRPPKIVPLYERQLCQIKYLSSEGIHKAQGLYTGGRNLGHTSSVRHVFSVSSPRRIFPCWWSPTCSFFQLVSDNWQKPAPLLYVVQPSSTYISKLLSQVWPYLCFRTLRSVCASRIVQQGPQSSWALLSWLSPEDSTVCAPLWRYQDAVSYKEDWKSS